MNTGPLDVLLEPSLPGIHATMDLVSVEHSDFREFANKLDATALVRSIQMEGGFSFFKNGLAIVNISSICMDIASGDANGPMHIDDISTIASPFSKKVNPHLPNPL